LKVRSFGVSTSEKRTYVLQARCEVIVESGHSSSVIEVWSEENNVLQARCEVIVESGHSSSVIQIQIEGNGYYTCDLKANKAER
jgi:hypothetical protein